MKHYFTHGDEVLPLAFAETATEGFQELAELIRNEYNLLEDDLLPVFG